MSGNPAKQVQQFQAETKQLLDLMIHSLYSHREIFLRELISNASDAIEKLKIESLTNSALAATLPPFEIRLDTDPQARTLVIKDNGIGMTREEVIQNIGTIAHSGTKAFAQMRQELKDHPELIGQFGVGFYSAFMVADKVTLHTQKAGTKEGILWESDGGGTYTIESAPRLDGHGTTITLHLKEYKPDAKADPKDHEDERPQDFSDQWTIRGIVKKYSDFIAYPIRMKTTRQETKDGKAETVIEDETLNSQKALWLRPASEIKPEEYSEFYHHLSHDWTDPLKTVHYKAEGTIEFVSIFYVPGNRPFDYFYRDHKHGLSLYIKRVFIMENCEELIPAYLRFIKGMVDSDDLSLNVSREMLQKDVGVTRIRKSLTNKILGSLRELLDSDREKYEKFWNGFGVTLKEGVPQDPSNTEKLKELLIFSSTASDKLTTLKEYVGRMKPDQKAIYYITGEELTQIRNSPYLERLASKGFEVLLLTDRVDSWVMRHLSKYEEKPLEDITSEHLDLDTEEEKKAREESKKVAQEKLKPLLETLQESLKEKVKEVRLSDRLTESPVCLVSDEAAASAHMERILESMGQKVPQVKRILEINSSHPLFERMLSIPKTKQEEWADILFQQALLNEGSKIDNPMRLAQRIADLMLAASAEVSGR